MLSGAQEDAAVADAKAASPVELGDSVSVDAQADAVIAAQGEGVSSRRRDGNRPGRMELVVIAAATGHEVVETPGFRRIGSRRRLGGIVQVGLSDVGAQLHARE